MVTFLIILTALLAILSTVFTMLTWKLAENFLERMDARDAAWSARIEALPTDITGARMLEALDKLGVKIPDPPPELHELEQDGTLLKFMEQGIALAEETGRQNLKVGKTFEGLDKRRVCLNYVRKCFADLGVVDFPESRLALMLETQLALMKLPKHARARVR